MEIKQLRDKFFRECCVKQEDGLQNVNMTPHNTFEWFVKHFTRSNCKQCNKATDELICHCCAVENYHIVSSIDTAVATAYFSSLYEANESFFNSIDKAYHLALKFVVKYPADTKWGIEENLEYEETLYNFFKLNH